jgi:cellulose synthase/poly-beta-1,6-N-acetylglucosamine synthase-like glycosyltransferase
MVFHRDVLERCPWKAHSAAEDMEYTLELIRNGIHVQFVPDVVISSDSPVRLEQVKIQRARWANGNLRIGRTQGLKLICEGLIRRRLVLVDAGWTLLVTSRPLVLTELLVAVVLAVVCVGAVPGPLSYGLAACALLLCLTQAGYFALGILCLGLSVRRLALLIGSPVVVLKLAAISLTELCAAGKQDWARTPR